MEGPPPPEGCPNFDWDCDGLSNQVEGTFPNTYLYNFDWIHRDSNPSVAHGLPDNGWLENGINLPDDGAGYYHYLGNDNLNHDDYGTLLLVWEIELVGRARDHINQFSWDYNSCHYWSNQYNWLAVARFGVGDLSKGDQVTRQFGGYFYPHGSHQNGLDVDIRFLRTDFAQAGHDTLPLDLEGSDSVYYDNVGTVDLINCFLYQASPDYYQPDTVPELRPPFEPNTRHTVKIFVDTIYAKISPRGETRIVHDTNHRDHFHVRVEDPDGPGN